LDGRWSECANNPNGPPNCKFPAPAPTVANPTPPYFQPVTSGPYVWHCHIVDHEDNEMMRPTLVMP
jgi:hypothetical protein